MKLHIIFFNLSLAIFSASLNAQQIKVKGRVLDANTKLPIYNASVYMIKTSKYVLTDRKGTFSFETTSLGDSISISAKNYIQQVPIYNASVYMIKTSKYVLTDRKGTFSFETTSLGDSISISAKNYIQQVQAMKKTNIIYLEHDVYSLEEVIIRKRKKKFSKKLDPAEILLKKIISHKERNNPEKILAIQYEKYNKLEVDLFKENFNQKRKIFKKFNFLYNYLDTSSIIGKPALPIFLEETLSDVYISKNKPSFDKEIVKASKISGLSEDSKYNTTVSQFTSKLNRKINIYDNYIKLFDKGFVSPIANSGLSFYRYYITDSMLNNGVKLYQLSFIPIRKEDATFIGELWVEDAIYAIQKVDMYITGDVNLNWIRNASLHVEFQTVNDSLRYWKKQNLFIEYSLKDKKLKKSIGFLAYSNTEFRNLIFNPIFPKYEIFANSKNWIVKENAYKKNNLFWEKNRPELLSNKEQSIYQMIDSLEEVPLYNTLLDVSETIFTGFFDIGKFDIGPLYRFLSFNALEDYKVSFGGRTNEKFSKRIRLKGYLDYTFKTSELKYKTNIRFLLNDENDLKKQIDFNAYQGVRQLGKGSEIFSANNILFSLLARNPIDKLIYMEDYSLNYFHQWSKSFSNSLQFKYTQFGSTDKVKFTYTKPTDETETSTINNTQLALNFRLTKEDNVVESNFSRYYLDSDVPIINLRFFIGSKSLGGDYNYVKIRTYYYHDVLINPIGKIEYAVEVEKIFGKVPFPLLLLHEGNETYAYDTYAYNLMNYYEFASDKFASIYVEHHFYGFIFNKIPLLKKTKWRTLVSGKILWGDLTDKNNGALEDTNAIFYFPQGMKQLDKPYIELGAGVENVLKIFRFDAIWRLTYIDRVSNDDTFEKFGIRVKMQFNF